MVEVIVVVIVVFVDVRVVWDGVLSGEAAVGTRE